MRPRLALLAACLCALAVVGAHRSAAPPSPPERLAVSSSSAGWQPSSAEQLRSGMEEASAAVQQWTAGLVAADQQRWWQAVAAADSERARQAAAARPRAAVAAVHPSGGSHRGWATARECTSMVEHGGSYDRSTNPTHFGRYQFDRPLWAAFGGNPDTWGSASPGEQDAVFDRAWASPGGPNNWLPYNGCGPYDGS